jgi:hypothetical protein
MPAPSHSAHWRASAFVSPRSDAGKAGCALSTQYAVRWPVVAAGTLIPAAAQAIALAAFLGRLGSLRAA